MMSLMAQDNPKTNNLSGLYAITPDIRDDFDLQRYVGEALSGGVRILQYRDKVSLFTVRLTRAQRLLRLCKAYQAKLIINDDVELAFASQAHGVHIGRDDTSLKQARLRLGKWATIGVSCYASLELAAQASEQGADYLAFGSMFPSPTKPDAPVCPLSTLKAARRFNLPLVAIGGITVENAPELIQVGADMLAVISGLLENPYIQAQRYSELWT